MLTFLKKLASNPVVLGALAAVTVIGVLHARIRHLERQVMERDLRADSLAAAADSTRLVLEGEVLVWERRALQVEAERDSLDRRLQVETRARLGLEVRVAALRDSITAPVIETPEGVRSATFAGREEPFTWSAEVELPPPPADGSLDLAVDLDPLDLEARVTCGEAEGTIRPALVNVSGPPWAVVNLAQVTQAPGVCNPEVEVPPSGSPLAYPVTGALAGTAAGYLADRSPEGAVIGALSGAAIAFLVSLVF